MRWGARSPSRSPTGAARGRGYVLLGPLVTGAEQRLRGGSQDGLPIQSGGFQFGSHTQSTSCGRKPNAPRQTRPRRRRPCSARRSETIFDLVTPGAGPSPVPMIIPGNASTNIQDARSETVTYPTSAAPECWIAANAAIASCCILPRPRLTAAARIAMTRGRPRPGRSRTGPSPPRGRASADASVSSQQLRFRVLPAELPARRARF